jgi:hypothetical protein
LGTLRSLSQKYCYGFKHDDASLADITTQLTAADSLCNPADAPAPKATHAVTDSMAILSEVVQSMEVTEDCEEQA